jgi:hypothetical protein
LQFESFVAMSIGGSAYKLCPSLYVI